VQSSGGEECDAENFGSVSDAFVQSSGGEECDAGVCRRLHLTIVFKLCVTVFELRFPVSF
jgi:hypothetical protein